MQDAVGLLQRGNPEKKACPRCQSGWGPLVVLGTAEGPRLTQRMSPWSAAGQAAPLQRE